MNENLVSFYCVFSGFNNLTCALNKNTLVQRTSAAVFIVKVTYIVGYSLLRHLIYMDIGLWTKKYWIPIWVFSCYTERQREEFLPWGRLRVGIFLLTVHVCTVDQVGHRPSNEGLSFKWETVSQMRDIFSSSNL